MRKEDFIKFDVERFLKSRNKWKEEIANLENELRELPMLPSVDNESGVRSSNISDLTARLGEKRISLEIKIAENNELERIYTKVVNSLDDDEKTLLNGFFAPTEPIYRFVDRYAEEKMMCVPYVYKARRELIQKIADIINNMIK